MNRWPRLAGVWCAGILALAPSAHAAKWIPLERAAGLEPVALRVKDHPRNYYRLTRDASLILTVEGPGRLRVLSRAEINRGAVSAVSYGIRVAEGGKTLGEQENESTPAEQVRLEGSDAVICKGRNLMIPIAKGTHRLTVTLSEAPSVLIRPFFSRTRRSGASMVSITPVEAPRSVTLSEGEKLIPYYSVLPGKPVRLRVVGPTTLELATRLDFDSTMRGVQVYRLGVSSGGRSIRDATFRTTKAATAAYTDLRDRIASKVDRLAIPLGEGLNEIVVELLEPKQGSAEIHARIPQPSVGSEE